ncbi:type IV secretory system conjugative DNA transfer family protein [Pseudovibrio ascidiaceicola]|uniref:type IV secretory system conjugative DNA transfer family protein n=1 Tax=Pseudovibrio ascidiaceicola TaxID=285279 RepID=UPI003D36F359
MHTRQNIPNSLHGTTRFAEPDDIKEMGYLHGNGVAIGGFKNTFWGTSMLRDDGPEHVLAFAPARSGKSVGLVLPALLTWPESTIQLDITGQNYERTSGWRAAQGQNVFRFEPSAAEGSARYNPLEEIRIETPYQNSDCINVATSLQSVWEPEAFLWLTCAILHVLYRVRDEEGRKANLADVLHFLCSTVAGAHGEIKEDDQFVKLLLHMENYQHGNADADKQVRRGASRMRLHGVNERTDISSRALASLAIFADPVVAQNTSACDFNINDLMRADQPTNVYLVLPPGEIGRMKMLMRLIINQVLTRLTTTILPYKHRMLLMLDDFCQLGKLNNLQRLLAIMEDYGIKAFLITPDITQLHGVYGRDECILSNCHIRIAYAPCCSVTAQVLSKMTGKATCESVCETSRPLMTPDECMLIPGPEHDETGRVTKAGKMLIFTAGKPTIYAQQFLFFADKELNARSKMKPSGILKDGKLQ